MWWMMGEAGGHYCSKKTDSICGGVCSQETGRFFSFSRLCCALRGVDMKTYIFLLVIVPTCVLAGYIHGQKISYFLRPLWESPPKPFHDIPHYHHENASMETLCRLHGWGVRDYPRRVYDAVLFSNELDILAVRWRELYPYITQFVLLESNSTFTGLPKPLVFAAHRGEFEFVEPRLTYGSLGGRFVKGQNPFYEEAYQRVALDQLLRIAGITDDDLLLMSDVGDSVDQLCWDPKHSDLVATASGDKSVRLWDARSGKCTQQAELSGENINITYRPDGTHIAVGNRDDELTILDVRKFNKSLYKRKFSYEVNEIAWNMSGDLFFLTTGLGTVEVLSYPLEKMQNDLKPVDTLTAHTAGCYCIAIDPKGRYFAVGSADSLVSLWDMSDMLCLRTFTKLDSPVRTISFNHAGEYIASASEDLFIDIANVQTGRTVHQIPCRAAMNSVEWNPKYNLLAYAGDDKSAKYYGDEGVFRIFGFDSS